MKNNISVICSEEASEAQIRSWDDCFDVLHDELREFSAQNPDLHIIF